MSAPAYYQSLGRSIIAWVVIVSLTPLLLSAALLGYQFHTAYRAKVMAHLEELVLKHRQNIDAFLRETSAELFVLTEVAPFADFKDEAKLAELLKTLQEKHGGMFTDLGLIDASGAQTVYAGPFRLGRADYADTSWFKEAMRHQVSVSDVFLGLRGLPHFVAAVKRTEGGRDYLVRSAIDFATFNNLVENIALGSTGLAFIINTKGEFQTTPKKSLQVEIPFLQRAVWGAPGAEAGATPATTSGVKIFSHEDPATGREAIYVATTLKSGEWALVYQQDDADAFAALYRTRMLSLTILLVGGVGIVLAAAWLSRRMTGRIAEADRAKELLNEQVIEAGKLASVGELAAGIAHEINNPVAIMMEEAGWVTDILADEGCSSPENLAEMRRALDQIKTQGSRCKEITHKLLSFARKTDSRVKELDLNALVAEVAELSEKRARYVNVKLGTDLAPGLPMVAGSPSEVQQLLLNLVNNAMDSMEKNGGTVTIATRAEGGRVILSVTDTGHGIPKANLPRIFDPFYTTKAVGKGTGLGLSICYGIVKKLGGEITVESTVGAGTTFRVSLPAQAAPPETAV